MRPARAAIALLVAVTTVVAGLVATPSVERAEAATASNFDPGYVVSDEKFFDGLAMGGAQIQAFLDSQVTTCQTGYTCLKDYRQDTPGMAADSYCAWMPQRTGQSASAMMYHIGRACDINPRVLLVLLQKEQSLVTLTAPSAIRYERATGFACPDTAPCDSSYGGFFYQLYYAARQFQRYATHPANYQHRAGAVNSVLYHPNASCGSSQVYIRNQATAGLYNYTPYQPNAAALANLYGTGDSCSAYGNRNFWRMWSDWFGSPTGPGPLVRIDGTDEHFLLDGSNRYRFASAALVSEYSRIGSVQPVSRAFIGTLVDRGEVGRVLRATDGRTFFVDEGKRFQFSSCAQMATWGYACTGATVGEAVLAGLQDGGRLNELVGWDGAWWHVSGGERHEIADTAVVGAAGISYANTWMSPGALDHLPIGAPLLAAGYGVRDSRTGEALLGTGASPLRLDPAQAGLRAFSGYPVVSGASFDAGRALATPLPNRIDYGDSSWVVTDAGLLQVSEPMLGGDAFFTDIPYPGLRGVPVAGSVANREHFQAEIGSTTVWWMHDGKREPITTSQVATIAAQRGISATVHRGIAGYLNWIPEHSDFQAGTLLRDEISGQLLLTSATTTLLVDDARIVAAMGLRAVPQTVSRSVRNGLPASGARLDDYGVRCAADLLLSGGYAHRYLDADTRADWAQVHEQLPADVCGLLRSPATPVGQAVTDSRGGLWRIEDGIRRPIDTQQTVASIGLSGQAQVVVHGDTLYALPRGAMVPPYWYTGTHVQGWGQSQGYLVDQGSLRPTSSTVMWELGFPHRPTVVPQEAIQVSATGAGVPTTLVSCGGISYAAIDQRLVRFPWRTALEYGDRFTPVSSLLCSKVPVSGWMTQYIRDGAGQVWFVDDGSRSRVDQAARGAFAPVVDQTMLDAIPVR